MSTALDLASDPAAALDVIRTAVERGASLLAGATRAAGPATPQDDTADLVPAPDALGVSVELDGIVGIVFLVGELADELAGTTDPAAVAGAVAPVLEEMGSAFGSTPGAVRPLAVAEVDARLAGAQLLVASGIFAADTVVATVAAAVVEGAAADPGAAMGSDVSAPGEADVAGGGGGTVVGTAGTGSASTSSPATAVPPRSATSAAATSDAPPAPRIGDAALSRGLSILAEVSLEVTAELGRAALRVSELLDLQPGSIIELDREAGAPVELFVNGTLFARGEVVVVDGQYAVRIIELLGGEGSR